MHLVVPRGVRAQLAPVVPQTSYVASALPTALPLVPARQKVATASGSRVVAGLGIAVGLQDTAVLVGSVTALAGSVAALLVAPVEHLPASRIQ